MIALWIAGGVVAVLAAGVVSYAARIRARHQRFLRSAPPAALVPDAGRILDQPQALYHGTKFADGVRLFASGWKEPCVCDVWCTEQGLFIRREGQGALLAIAHEEVVEASLHRAFAKIAGDDLPMLRLRWRRGGESMVTELSLRGGMASLEALRREIHLRQGNVAKQLAPLLTRTPE